MEQAEFLYNVDNECPSIKWKDGADFKNGKTEAAKMCKLTKGTPMHQSCMSCWQEAMKDHNEHIEGVEPGECPCCSAVVPVGTEKCSDCGYVMELVTELTKEGLDKCATADSAT